MKLVSFLRVGVAAAALVTAEGAALAQPPRAVDDGETDDPAFRYDGHLPPDYARAAFEEVGILAIGYGEYTLDKSNSADWDLGVDWPSFRSKLLLSSVSFDTNRFDTNWLTHPLAGYFYYGAARGNRLGIAASFALSVSASTLWEMVGEIREQAAINDLIVTPVSSVPIAESMMQLGAFFQRARPTPVTRALAWTFAPLKLAHDHLDGLEPYGPIAYDDDGLPEDGWHRFRMGAEVGVTHQQDGVTQGDGRVFGETRLVTLPGYGHPGRHFGWFDAGQISSIRLDAATAEGRLVDFRYRSSVVPFGYWDQHVGATPHGALVGRGTIVGLQVGAEYGTHDYDRDDRRRNDRIALVAAGPTIRHDVYAGALTLRTRVDVLASFAGVDAYAFPEYAAQHGTADLSTVLAQQHYYHAYGGTLRAEIEADVDAFDAGVDVRADGFGAITALDRNEGRSDHAVSASDRRLWARAWIGAMPTKHLHLTLAAERHARGGRVDNAKSHRSEVGIYAGVAVQF